MFLLLSLTLWGVATIKNPGLLPSVQEGRDFFAKITPSLAVNILRPMGWVNKKKFWSFRTQLIVIAVFARDRKVRLDLARESEIEVRRYRVHAGRARKKIAHSLEFLIEAEQIGQTLQEWPPGLPTFDPARRALLRLEKAFAQVEATAAKLLHPTLRKRNEKDIASRSSRRLFHPDLKATEGSSALMHRTVEMLDDELRKFTRGKVPPKHIDKFICEFLQALFWKGASVANVKTIRQRYKDRQGAFRAQPSSPFSIPQ